MVARCLLCLTLWAAPAMLAGPAQEQAPQNPAEQETEAPDQGEQPPIGMQPVPDYQGEETNTTPSIGTGSMLFRTLGALILVLGAFLLLLWGARKLFPQQLGIGVSGSHLRLLQSLPLGPKRYVSLIEADGKRLLVGVTETQINLIKDLDEIGFENALEGAVPPPTVRELMEEE